MVVAVIPTYRSRDKVYIGHFGDAEVYLFYRITGDNVELISEKPNPYRGEHSLDEESGKRRRVFELVGEADILVATAFGPGGREYMEKRGKKVVIVKPRTTVEEALSLIAGSLDT